MAKLQQMVEVYRAMLDAAGKALILTDQRGLVLTATTPTLEILGISAEEAEGTSLASLLYTSPSPEQKKTLAGVLSAGQPTGYDIVDEGSANGARLTVSMSPLNSPGGGQRMLLHELSTCSVASEEEHLRQTLAATNDGIWEYNLQTREYRYSKRFAEILGFTPEEFAGYGIDFHEKIHPDDTERYRRSFEDYLQGKTKRYDIEFRLRDRDGQYRWIYSRGSIVERDEDGSPARIIGANTDIDERKRSEIILSIRLRLIEQAQDCSLPEILQKIADECELLTDSAIGFVHFLLKEKQQISLQAWSSRTESHFCRHQALENHYPFAKAGVWADCVRRGEAVIYNDYQSLKSKKGTPAGHPPLVRVLTVPVMRGDTITAIFGVGNKSSDYTDKDLAGFQQIADFSWDIIERKMVVESLRASEERFSTIFQAAPMLMSISRMEDGCYLQVNDAFVEITGFARDEVIGRTSVELGILKRDDRRNLLQDLHGRGRVKSRELTLHRVDGAEMICLYCMEIVEIEGRKRLLSIAVDITEQKHAQAAIRQQQENLNLIFNSIPMVLALVDGQGRIVDINHSGRRFFGREREEILGLLCGEVFGCINSYDGRGCGRNPVCKDCPVRTRVEHTHATGLSHMEEEARMSFLVDGRERFVDLLISTVPIRHEADTTVLLLLNDITSRKKAEQEQTVLREQLHQALRLESIGRLAGGVAHDLNNLLSPIHGYGEMLVEDLEGNDSHREFAQQVVNGAERASDLIRQLLVFSRRQVLEFKPVDINVLVENFKKLLCRTIREDIEMTFSLAENIAAVEADVGQLEQVIMNLAVNAQDAMISGGTLTIETAMADDGDRAFLWEKAAEPANFVKIMVGDTGHGMDESLCRQIFEPFFTTKGPEEGTGLGLSTVYGIVKQHKGFVAVESTVGRGTIFKIFLPAFAGESDHEAGDMVQRPERQGSETILVVEDDERLLKLIAAALQRKGYHVKTASSAKEALALFEGAEKPVCDLLLTDIVMPGMNGRELGLSIEKKFSTIKVMYMSGYADDIITRKGVLIDQVNFLEKPFSTKALVAKVQDVLAGQPN